MSKSEWRCQIVFVGSNPSTANTIPSSPFAGTKSKEVLYRWIHLMQLSDRSLYFFNVSNEVTENNRPLKREEFQLDRLKSDLEGSRIVVALGNTAEEALRILGISYFKMPHPSPRNRQLNNPNFVDKIIKECKAYIEEREAEDYERFQSNSNQDPQTGTDSQGGQA